MKLPFNLFNKNSEETSEYYLALLLTDEKVSAVVLHESLGQLKMLKSHEEFFSTSLEDIILDDLINFVDRTISQAEEILPPNIQTHKTVFGVKDDWVEDDTKKIKKEYLAKLKKVCDALDLSPIGFMVVTEAISHLLQEKEGAPLSAILGDVGKKTITLSLVRGGKIVERIQGPLVGSAPATVDDLLKHFTATVLPARIILYDGKKIETLSQAFISHQWSKGLPFLHVPQISTLPQGFDLQAVTCGAATQMGFTVIGMPSLDTEKKEVVSKETTEKEKEEQTDEIQPEKVDTKEPLSEKEATAFENADSFGFVSDQDIQKTMPQPPSMKDTPAETATMDKAESEKETFSDNFSHVAEEENKTPTKTPMASLFGFLSARKLPHFTLPEMSGRKKLLIPLGAILVIIILLGIFTAFYFNSVKANIVLVVEPKMVDQEESVIFSGESTSNFAGNMIAAKPLEATVDGSLSIATTGKKDVGDKAKGKVTVYNNANSSTKLDSGTQIKSSNNIIFVLDKDITVASASGDVFSGTKPGTADVEVTAKDIGTEGNLPSGTRFTIGSTSTLAAKNDSAFSGGTKKQVQVVSKNDVAKLRVDLPKSLEAKAQETISQNAGSDETLLPFVTVTKIGEEKFDNEVDKEAKNVKLTANVTFSSLAYNNSELTDYAKFLFKEKYSQDISEDSIETAINDPEENEDEEVEAKLAIKAGLLPDIDTADVVSKVENLSRSQALSYLSDLPQVAKTQINFSPGIPLIFNFFPRLPNQINVEVQTQEN